MHSIGQTTKRPLAIYICLMLLFTTFAQPSHGADVPLFTEDELAWIAEHPVITIGINHVPEPLSIVHAEKLPAPPPHPKTPGNSPMRPPLPGGELPQPLMHGQGDTFLPLIPITEEDDVSFTGVAADYLREVSTLTGIEFKITFLSPNSIVALHETIVSGDVGLTPTILRRQEIHPQLLLSDPYLSLPMVIVMRAEAPHMEDYTSLKDMKVAGTLPVAPKLHSLGLEVHLEHASPHQGIIGVVTGKYDAFISELSSISTELNRSPMTHIKIVGELPAPSTFSMGVSPALKEFVPILNKALQAIPQDRKSQIQRTWFPVNYDTKIVSSGWLVTIGLVSVLALLLAWAGLMYYRKRMRRMQDGIAALEPHMLCVNTDTDITIIDVTRALCDLTGFSPEELIGRPFTVLSQPKDGDSSQEQLFAMVESGTSWQGEVKLVRKDGSKLWTDVVIAPRRRENEANSGYTIIYQDASERKHLQKLALRDGLTGLFNKRQFDIVAPEQLAAARSENKHFCLLLMDVDFFKKYNDTYGHPAGDEVLRSIGATLQSTLKRVQDTSFRLGGEEFGALISLSRHQDVTVMAQRMLDSLHGLAMEHKLNPPGVVTMSMGIAIEPPHGSRSITELYEAADKALYGAKEHGRNRYVVEERSDPA